MNEVISFDVPMQTKELNNPNNIVDDPKSMSYIYSNYCLQRYTSEVGDDVCDWVSIWCGIDE